MLDNLFIKQYNKNNVKSEMRYIYAKKQRKKYG